ncbi:group-specific protein [Bacillus sp. NEB1478]|uniref:group-specific protein n=1 Tax=Bacillus sp. NEB1478 TaxID=3073816 RepID=UPI002872BFD2|nr:group-specific protein [Bacillus sp. NEB1478]WNB90197.1 group-specific protein [Bacillus sp. NEB1478]
MNFYIASGFQNKIRIQDMASEIQKLLGWNLTYDWTQNGRAITLEDLARIGTKEYEGVMNSDVVIVILPGGKGCHTELGIALGAQKCIILYDPEEVLGNYIEATTFYYLSNIKHWSGKVHELNDLIKA